MGLVAALEAAGRPDEAVEPLLDFYRLRRGDLESGQAAIGLMERVQRPEEADDFRWELIEDMRMLPPPGRKRLEQVLFEALQRAVAAQDDERALKALSILAAHSPDGASFRDQMVRLLLARGLLDRALAVLREELRAAPKNADLLRVIVRIHRAMGNPGAALGDIATGLGHVPDHVGLLADRADMMMEAKRWADAEAVPALERLRARFPDELDALDALVHSHQQLGRNDLAVRLLEARARRAPGDLERRKTLIWLLVEDERLKDAAAHVEAIIARAPGDAQAWLQGAYLRETVGDTAGAIALYERYLKLFPEDDKSLEKLAGLYATSGRRKDAISVLQSWFEATEEVEEP
jgi:tetratricopeptide (TPR) repeat protein